METVAFKHTLNAKVKVMSGQLDATVVGLFIDKSGNKDCLVEYFDKNGAYQRHYIPEADVE